MIIPGIPFLTLMTMAQQEAAEKGRRLRESAVRWAAEAVQRGCLTPALVDQITHESREQALYVQQEGFHAACDGASRDAVPYGPSHPSHNHWIYGYMQGWEARRKDARNASR